MHRTDLDGTLTTLSTGMTTMGDRLTVAETNVSDLQASLNAALTTLSAVVARLDAIERSTYDIVDWADFVGKYRIFL